MEKRYGSPGQKSEREVWNNSYLELDFLTFARKIGKGDIKASVTYTQSQIIDQNVSNLNRLLNLTSEHFH